MKKDTFSQLGMGDVVRSKASKEAYTVTGNYGGRVTTVNTVDMTNPDEWDLVLCATRDCRSGEHDYKFIRLDNLYGLVARIKLKCTKCDYILWLTVKRGQ